MSSLKYLVLADPRYEGKHRLLQSTANAAQEVEEEVLTIIPCTEKVFDIALSRAFGTDSSLENHFPEVSHPTSPEKGGEQCTSTGKESTAIASLMAETDGEADSENPVDDTMLAILGTGVVNQFGSLSPISSESRPNSAVLAADLGHLSESNFSGDSK